MASFFQHVGEKGGAADFPKTIGVRAQGLRFFTFGAIEGAFDNLTPAERRRIRGRCEAVAPGGFQVWGVPSGAKNIIRDLKDDDFLFLLRSAAADGRFEYGGKVVAQLPSLEFKASRHFWQSDKFPVIILLRGDFSDLRWNDFCQKLGYSPTWNPAGRTYPILEDRFLTAGFRRDEDLYRFVVGKAWRGWGAGGSEAATDDLLDIAELDVEVADGRFIEGRRKLRAHIVAERSAALIRAFKNALPHFRCSVCDFDFERQYGRLGAAFIEAHHRNPIADMPDGKISKLGELEAVCSNCHRMLHRRWPPYTSAELRDALAVALEEHGGAAAARASVRRTSKGHRA